MEVDYANLDKYLKAVHDIMRPLQIGCVSHLKKNIRCIVDSYMGTGKTLMVLTATFLRRPRKVLIACSKNALYTWKKEIDKWYPEYGQAGMYNVISGSPTQRRKLWSKNSLFYVCTYGTLRNDIEIAEKLGFDVFILDEFHRAGLRQHVVTKARGKDPKTGRSKKTATGYGIIKQLSHIPCIYPVSGTVLSRGPHDVWPTLNILSSKLFSSYWKFVNTFCIVVDGPFGKSIEGVQNTAGLRQVTKPYWYRIPREEAEKELPPLTKQLIPIEMSVRQRQLYTQMEEEMYIELTSGDLRAASTIIGKLTRLRQILACPKILDPDCDDYGPAIENVVDYAKDIEDHHLVVFTPYRDGVIHLKEYLRQHLTPNVFHIWGGLDPEDLHARIAKWKQTKGAMVCTVLFSQSFELETSNQCHFVGYEWDQNDNNQASSRLRRLINPRPITARYLQHIGTIDEHVLDIANEKTRNVKITVQDFADMMKPVLEKRYGK